MLVCKHLGKVKRRGTDGEYIFACPKVEARQTTLKDCAGCKLLDLSKQMVIGGSSFSEAEYGDRLPVLAAGGGCGGKKKLVDKSASLPIIGQDADGREILDFGSQASLKCPHRSENMVGSEKITLCPNKTRSMAIFECQLHGVRCSHQKYTNSQPERVCLVCKDGPMGDLLD